MSHKRWPLVRPFFYLLWGALFTGLLFNCISLERQRRLTKEPEEPLFWPPPPASAKVQYIKSVSSASDLGMKKSWFKKVLEVVVGPGMETIVKPMAVAAEGDKLLCVSDSAWQRVHLYDMVESKHRTLYKTPQGPMLSPVGVAIDSSQNIYVSDSMLGHVYVYSLKGKFLRSIGKQGELERPTGIAIDKQKGLLYVADSQGHRVVVYDLMGRLKEQFGQRGGGQGQLNYPTHINLGRDGLLYLCDSMNFRVQLFSPAGKVLTSFGSLGDGTGDFSRPTGIGVDSQSHIYVVDALFDNVQVFDREGNFLLAFGSSGREPGEFWLPSGLFIDEQDRIYVADSYNNRIQLFQYVGG